MEAVAQQPVSIAIEADEVTADSFRSLSRVLCVHVQLQQETVGVALYCGVWRLHIKTIKG